MDISKHNFNEVIIFLSENNYPCCRQDGSGEFALLCVIDDTNHKFKYYINYYSSYLGYVKNIPCYGKLSILDCSGIYKGVALFNKGKNVTTDYVSNDNVLSFNMKHFIPENL